MCNSVLGNNLGKSNEKNLILSFSLLMRLFEFMHEDAKDDVAMHKVMEKLVAFSDGTNPLTMEVYDCLIADVQTKNEDMSSDEDLQNAYELGQEYAENGVELSSDGEDYSLVAGEIITDEKDNGYGASNAELEQFWQGYDCGEIETLRPSCFSNYDVDMSQYDGKPMTITLCADDDCYAVDDEECCDIPIETMDEIEKIINISKGF